MKRLFSSLVMLMFICSALTAQDYNSAKKAFRAYEFDKENNIGKLSDAVKGIDKSMDDPELQTDPGFWLTRGKIYQEVGTNDLLKLKQPKAPENAKEAYLKVLDNTPKGFQKKEAIAGLRGMAPIFQNKGVALFSNKEFKGAHESLQSVLDLDNLLKEMGEPGAFKENTQLQDIKYYTGYAAHLADDKGAAKDIFTSLYAESYDNVELYKFLFDLTIEEDEKKAFEMLEEGRSKAKAQLVQLDKNDEEQAKKAADLEGSLTGMLFSEINYYLEKGQLDVLETKLKEAIAAEPNNISLYSSLGKVYDDLYQEANKEGKNDDATKYFGQAKEYYEKALGIDGNYLQAVYNLGALYFNKSAGLTKVMNNTVDMKKYNEMKKEVESLYEEALPYFHRAEKIDPNDYNTLYALKEIYAIKDDLVKSKEYKIRLEALGGNN